ncbi:MAG: hemerythrin domain-containing protein [Nakamurella sp.]
MTTTDPPEDLAANQHFDQRVTAWGLEMRAVHQRLRDTLQFAREAVEDGSETDSLAKNLELFCWGFCGALTGHHGSEDATLFPLLLRRAPELAGTVQKLVQDHNMLALLIGDLEFALAATSEQAILLRHLDGIEAVMETHFRFEEKQLVEVLDEMADLIGSLNRTALFGPIA